MALIFLSIKLKEEIKFEGLNIYKWHYPIITLWTFDDDNKNVDIKFSAHDTFLE